MALFQRRWFGARRQWGIVLLGVWLMAVGLLPLIGITDSTVEFVVHGLAVAAGLLLLLSEARR